MDEDELDAEIGRIVREFLSASVEVHKRRIAIRQGNVGPVTDGCDHKDWDWVRQWCDGCGVTKVELLTRAFVAKYGDAGDGKVPEE